MLKEEMPNYLKGAKWIPVAGDIISSGGAVMNIALGPNNPEYYADAVFTAIGWIPLAGDIVVLLYTGAKHMPMPSDIDPRAPMVWENPMMGKF